MVEQGSNADYCAVGAPRAKFAPPCLSKSHKFRSVFEYSTFCKKVGALGFQSASDNRQKVMGLATLLSLIALGLTAFAVAGITQDSDTLLAAHWVRGEAKDLPLPNGGSFLPIDGSVTSINMKLFIGLNMQLMVIYDQDDNELFRNATTWWDTNCMDEYCSSCKDSSTATVSVAILAVFTMLPTLQTDWQRSTFAYDLNCQKGFAVFMGGLVGFISTMSSLSSFAAGCYREMPDMSPPSTPIPGIELTWNFGPGFAAIIVATCFKWFDIMLHCIIPTPPECQGFQDIETGVPEAIKMNESSQVAHVACPLLSLKQSGAVGHLSPL